MGVRRRIHAPFRGRAKTSLPNRALRIDTFKQFAAAVATSREGHRTPRSGRRQLLANAAIKRIVVAVATSEKATAGQNQAGQSSTSGDNSFDKGQCPSHGPWCDH